VAELCHKHELLLSSACKTCFICLNDFPALL
jgi:hypothetical protein